MSTSSLFRRLETESSLPRPLTPLVGRVWEVAASGALLRDPQVRLLTLTGPGGVGKTRLALRLAQEAAGAFPHGIAFISLGAIVAPGLVLPTIVQQIGLPEGDHATSLGRLRALFAGGPFLLVLDNFEQVVVAAPVVSELLTGSPSLKVLVTSRIPLHLSGEQEFPIPPLALPPADPHLQPETLAINDAVALFLQRVRAIRPDFMLDEQNAAAVAGICRRLDGLPLAIELAAARTKILSPQTLMARMDDRFHLLASGPRDVPERLQTMYAAIAWSHDLLTEAEQRIFRRLTVFSGGFDLEAAEALQDSEDRPATFDCLASLVDCNLLLQRDGPSGESRFAMLETIREYGLGELAKWGEVEEFRHRHAAWCLAGVDQAWPKFVGRKDQPLWLERFEAEHDNMRAALSWLTDQGQHGLAMRLATGLFWFWYIRGYFIEGRGWLERTIANAGDAPVDERARALVATALIAHFQGDDTRAIEALDTSWALVGEKGDYWTTSFGEGVRGLVAEDTGSFAEALPHYERALARVRAVDDKPAIALLLDHIGVVTWALGERDRACVFWEEALALQRGTGDTWGASISLSYLGIDACERGDIDRAARLHDKSLRLRWELRNTEDVAHSLANAAMVASARGDVERAARLFSAAEATHEFIGNIVKEPERTVYARSVASTRAQMTSEAFEAAWEAGRRMPIDEAVAEALADKPTPTPEVGELLSIGATLRAKSPGDYNLTEREVEVLRLLVEGKSDREIGAALFISPRTAQAHVSHILAKLGASTRTAATATALRNGIVSIPTPS